MLNFLKTFKQREDGAVSVDWVVLSAAIVGVAVGAITQVQGATDVLAGSISTNMTNITVGGANGSGG